MTQHNSRVTFLPLITGLLFSVPFFVLLSMHISDQSRDVDSTREELRGLSIVINLQRVENAVATLQLNPSPEHIQDVLVFIPHFKKDPVTFAHLVQALESLQVEGMYPADKWFDEVLSTIQDIRHQAMDDTALVADPDMDSYYLQNIINISLPGLKSHLRPLFSTPENPLSPPEKAELEENIFRIESEVDNALRNDEKYHGISQSLQNVIPPLTKDFLAYSREMASADITLIRGKLKKNYLQKQNEFESAILSELKKLLEIRIAAIHNKVRIQILFSLFLWLLGTGVTFFLMRRINDAENLLKKQTEQMVAGEKLATLGVVSASVAHEVLNPITAIKFQLLDIKKELRSELLNTNMIKINIGKIDRIIDRTISTIRGLKEFARQDTEEDVTKVFLPELVEDALTITEPRLRQLKADVKVDENIPQIYWDCRPGQIIHLLVNLIINSADAIEKLEQKWVHINVESRDNMIIFRVIDSGPGIPAELATQILTPFFTTKPSGKGLGLGLTICQKIANEHQGQLNINREFSNTCFEVRLPHMDPKSDPQ